MNATQDGKADILGREDIERLVDRFYASVRQDPVLGPVFDEIAEVNWDHHLPRLCDFWETVLFRTGSYRGNPLAVHRHLLGRTPMDRAMFDRWLDLFSSTVDRHFAGDNAGHIKRVAGDMANVIHSRLHELPQGVPGRYAR
ncbi:group III truncated hemoglobin [Luteolibacter sp. SL250]|uniref:group III truncated hemoglobin n=1 Tax=Luteolibacter sp. SL250 TaxID=2995170 RepID=UPI00226FCD6D|nr:group III truncated hemoglobin [Luteolibacter sp. SL250]WAC18156.1 group III truncated hemoglobin [Luteolibacter sp. SL250]